MPARRMLATLGGILALVSVPGSALSQSPTERLQADDDSKRITDEISAAQATGGPRSPDLIDPLTELAALLAAESDHALAIAALEEARRILDPDAATKADRLEQALQVLGRKLHIAVEAA